MFTKVIYVFGLHFYSLSFGITALVIEGWKLFNLKGYYSLRYMVMVREKFESLTENLAKLPIWKIILIGFFLSTFITFLQQIALHLWGTLNVDVLRQILAEADQEDFYLLRIFFFGVIYIPLVETLLYQTAVMNIFFFLDYEYEYKIALPVIVSALIFGLVHGRISDNMADSIIKIIGSFLIGLVLAYRYAIFHYSNRKATL